MKRLLFAGLLLVAAAGFAGAEDSRYQIFQGSMLGEPGKSTAPVPVVIKLDTGTGDTWRLLATSGGYWWIPVKNGMIKSRAAEEKPAAEETVPGAEAPAPK